ncbi:MAG: glycosyltransferase family 4 protein [Acidimicrobiales bacterium]
MTTRVLVVTADVLRAQMAGPAMRAWHIADHLARDNEVRLLTTSRHCEVTSERFEVRAASATDLAEAGRWCDVMVLQGYVTHHHPELASSAKIVVFDMYDPLHLETLALTKGMPSPGRQDHVRLSIATVNGQLARADFLLCASERQRDMWLGQLSALGRVNPLTYDDDPTLRRLIDVVPFGLPDDDPVQTGPALRGAYPGIGPGDDLVLWAGGIYDWFDPLTVIRAVKELVPKRPTVRLYFMGTRHPNPDVPPMRAVTAARALADELGLTGTHVFFNEGWVPYAQRQDYLLEADLGVSAHFASAEAHFAFRTRALDYLWAQLPIVSTEGDYLADMVKNEGLGLTVPPEDPTALAEAMWRILADYELAKRCRDKAGLVRERYRWAVALRPLARFCSSPRRAPDLVGAAFLSAAPIYVAPAQEEVAVSGGEDQGEPLAGSNAQTNPLVGGPGPSAGSPGPAPLHGLVELALHHYREGGVRQLAARAAAKALRAATKRWKQAKQPPG